MLSLFSVAVNCAFIFFTSNALSYMLDTYYSDLSKFMIIVMIEHLIIGCKLFISIVIKDKLVTQSRPDPDTKKGG